MDNAVTGHPDAQLKSSADIGYADDMDMLRDSSAAMPVMPDQIALYVEKFGFKIIMRKNERLLELNNLKCPTNLQRQ